MNNPFNKFINELSNLHAHQTGRFYWTDDVDILNRTVRIVMRDRLSDARLARLIPYDYILVEDPVEQARKVIELMEEDLKEATMMSVDEAIDQLEDLESDVWSGARDGRPIYVDDNDFRALQVAIEALKEKLG